MQVGESHDRPLAPGLPEHSWVQALTLGIAILGPQLSVAQRVQGLGAGRVHKGSCEQCPQPHLNSQRTERPRSAAAVLTYLLAMLARHTDQLTAAANFFLIDRCCDWAGIVNPGQLRGPVQ